MLEEPSSLMARLYKAKYFPNCDVLGASIGSNPSYAWRSIHKSLEVLKQGTRWKVGNGKLIHICDDKCLPTPMTYKVISHPKDFGDFPMVSSLIDEDIKMWRRDRLVKIFLPFEVNTILNIPLSQHLSEDSIILVGNKKGIFFVKSASYVAKKMLDSDIQGETSRGDVRAPLWKRIWQLNIPEKIRIFAWRLCMNAISTMVNLNRRGIQVEVLCLICKKEEEVVEHVILKCELAKAVWSK